MPQTAGRPPNMYGVSVPQFLAQWKMCSKSTKRTFDPGFGAIGYVAPKDRHEYRVILTPCLDTSGFFWVRIETADNEVGFTVPAPMDLKTIDEELFLHWDIHEPLWVPGHVRTSRMPGTLPQQFNASGHDFFFFTLPDENKGEVVLQKRRGLHTLPKGHFAGVVSCIEQPEDLKAFWSAGSSAVFPNVEAPFQVVDKVVRRQLRMVGAAWAKRWFVTHRDRTVDGLKDEGKLYPFIPHFKQLQTPQFAISEFKP